MNLSLHWLFCLMTIQYLPTSIMLSLILPADLGNEWFGETWPYSGALSLVSLWQYKILLSQVKFAPDIKYLNSSTFQLKIKLIFKGLMVDLMQSHPQANSTAWDPCFAILSSWKRLSDHSAVLHKETEGKGTQKTVLELMSQIALRFHMTPRQTCKWISALKSHKLGINTWCKFILIFIVCIVNNVEVGS